ncbi:ABC transporter ATP-binding protein [Planktothrix sp. FACHB-1355]|uniref:ABC transporter ATP-binding protein n=1 Tax=Aerosakkonema funiforme FACHB-1375 TaxID=2949571 RepID=A0A926ZHX3_9CYAN|nr:MULTISPECIES: ABC transporter ATP-binding protein [Oscillatoriales]MBD2182647.1 ABC transporter ATP-binding protein [Aerosakkonema funiforme FACHB-1375]MBD3559363.1 ABC transporter ATP-binding protein [Planktothrix sp. FACHB-1355]
MKSLRHLKIKLKGGLSQLPYLLRSLMLVWAAAKKWTIVWAILLVVQGLLPVVTVYLTQQLIDNLVPALGAGANWEKVRSSLMLVALIGSIILLSQILGSLLNWVRTVQSELVRDYISNLIHEKSIAIDYAFYEIPEYYDRLHRARQDAYFRPVTLLENGGNLLQNSITLMAMAVVLTRFGIWLPLALLISTLPAFYVVVRYSNENYQWWLRTTADERRSWYYYWLLTEMQYAAELRLFGLGEHFKSAYRILRRKLRSERVQLARNESLANLGASAIALVLTAVALAWMVWQAILGRVTLGDLALFYQAFDRGQNVMRSLLGNLGQIYSNMLFLGNLFEFLELPPQTIDSPSARMTPTSLKRGICFDRVTFRYPGSQKAALQNFNLAIPAGKIVAIVGANGAGKSTLLKLLCRLYDPQEGNIKWDDVDLREFPIQHLRRLITVLFQQPVGYNASVAENIGFGDVTASASLSEIIDAARGAGAEEVIDRLPKGYHTLLGKLFESGTELSGGEWQRIALARAFLRQAPLIILDEPTSAMDSWAEADWMERFRQLALFRTAIIITHRFTIARRADIIHVMADGQIVESGSHDELLVLGKLYAQSWQAQINVNS